MLATVCLRSRLLVSSRPAANMLSRIMWSRFHCDMGLYCGDMINTSACLWLEPRVPGGGSGCCFGGLGVTALPNHAAISGRASCHGDVLPGLCADLRMRLNGGH